MEKLADYKADLIATGKYRPQPKPISSKIVYIEKPGSNLPVSAGTGEFLDENNFEMVRFPASTVPENAEYGIRVNGNSMEPVYRSGKIYAGWIGGTGMGEIYKEAVKESTKQSLERLLTQLEALPPDTKLEKGMIKSMINDVFHRPPNDAGANPYWDFSKERAMDVFASDELLTIRPLTESYKQFYYDVCRQWSVLFRDKIFENDVDIFWNDTIKNSSFYCVIERAEDAVPIGYIGYIGIKDTSSDLWELSMELDGKYRCMGFGTRANILFIRAVAEATGEYEFQAIVEVDNLASQKCMDKIGAELIGLCCSPAFQCEEDMRTFEESHSELITDHMRMLADKLGVEPQKLLSHVLEYGGANALGEQRENPCEAEAA